MRGKRLKLSLTEYLLLSAPHGNDGVLLRQRKEIYPEPYAVLLIPDLCFARWNAKAVPSGPLISDL